MLAKTIIITGASDGIGEAAARKLKSMGHSVVVVGRNPDKTERVAKEISTPYFTADFAKLNEVVNLSQQLEKFPQIDVLCNNAGAAMNEREITVDGLEKTFQVNVLAPFLLTYLLKEKLCQSGATVLQTTSIAADIFGRKFDINDLQNENNYSPLRAYGNAKLCGFLLTKQWQKRFGKAGFCAVAFQPGIPRTNFGCESTGFLNFAYHSPLKYLFTIPKSRSAKRMVYFANSTPNKDFECGEFYSYKKKYRLHFDDSNCHVSDELWLRCESMVRDFLQKRV